MANANWLNPTTSSNYLTFPGEIKDRDEDLATMFDGSTATNLPTNTIRWSSTNSRFEKWNDTVWGVLDTEYAINVTTFGGLGVTGFLRLGAGLGDQTAQSRLIVDTDDISPLYIKGGSSNGAFISLFADSAAQTTRSGAVGFLSAGVRSLIIQNDSAAGNIQLFGSGTNIITSTGAATTTLIECGSGELRISNNTAALTDTTMVSFLSFERNGTRRGLVGYDSAVSTTLNVGNEIDGGRIEFNSKYVGTTFTLIEMRTAEVVLRNASTDRLRTTGNGVFINGISSAVSHSSTSYSSALSMFLTHLISPLSNQGASSQLWMRSSDKALLLRDDTGVDRVIRAAPVDKHISMGCIYRQTGQLNSQLFYRLALENTVTEDTWTTVGPTNSGATVIWQGMDVIPAGATGVLVDLFMEVSSNNTVTVASAGIRVKPETYAEADTFEGQAIGYVTAGNIGNTGDNNISGYMSQSIIPLNSNGDLTFQVRWFGDNVGNVLDLHLMYRGYTM